jgi:hypothetical protein
MLRSFLLGILAVSAVASCKGKEGGPAVQAGVMAGKVTELTGTVTAKRGTESRTLAAGNEVSGDDVIETGPDSSVSIVLAHNNATWSLGANKHEKVADSMAWSLAKVDKPALGAAESTSAAGRHAEKAGASSNATATDGMQDKKADESAAAVATTAPPAQAPSAEPAPGSAPAAKTVRPVVTAPREEAARARAMEDAPSAGGGGGSLGLTGTGPGGGGRGDGIGLGGAPEKGTANAKKVPAPASVPSPIVAAESPPPPPPPPPPSDVVGGNGGVAAQPEIQVLATRERTKLAACLDASMTSLSVVLSVEKGKATFEVPGGTPAAVSSCLAKIAATMKPSADLTTKLTVKIAKQ